MNLDVMPSSSNINSNMDKNILSSDSVIRRYTRSSLYLLRNDSRSQKRPECSLRYELQMLGLWKSTFLQNVNDVTNEGANQSSLINFVNDRSFRSNASNSSNSSQLSTYLPTNSGFHNNQKPYMDHRSISSAHLMPAFAKRRIIANCATPNYMSNPRSESINESKDPNYIKRQVIKERTFENHHRSDISNISPKKTSNVDNDVDQCSEQEASPSLSLLSTTPSKTPNNGNQERRIGSGRLLSRDISWDYKGQDKDRTIPAMNKEISLSNNQLNQKRNIIRYNERMERRAYDRNLIESGEKIESFKNDILKAGNTRYIASNESIKLDYTSNRQLLPGRNRRNHFNDRKTEPEWFSEGPTSKLDTIELRGFEEVDDDTGILNNVNKSEATYPDDNGLNCYIEDKESEEHDDKNLRCLEQNISDIQHTKKNIVNENNFVINNKPPKTIFEKIQNPKKNEAKNKSTNNFQKSTDTNNYNSNDSLKAIFNFENFLSIDSLEHTIMCNDQHKNFDDLGNSRFTQWFANKRDQPLNNSIQCDKNVNFTEPKSEEKSSEKNMLMEFFQNSKLPMNGKLDAAQPSVVAIPSVEELEARMRHTKFLNNEYRSSKEISESPKKQLRKDLQTTQIHQPPTHEVEAFKKLLEQLSAGRKLQPLSNFVDKSNHVELSANESQPIASVSLSDTSKPNENKKIGNNQVMQVDPQQTRLTLPLAVQQQLTVPKNYIHPDQNLIALLSPQIASGFIDHLQKQNQIEPNQLHQGVNMLSQENSNPIIMQRFVHTNSPTPLAFTPTSVLRKMTAEKENSTPQQQTVVNKPYQSEQQNQTQQQQNSLLQQPAPRMILGGSNHPSQQHPSNNAVENVQFISQQASIAPDQTSHNLNMKWPNNFMHQNSSLNKPIGRPILKGNMPVLSTHQPQKQQNAQQIAEISFASKMELQQIQQQRLRSKSNCQNIINHQQTSNQTFSNQMPQSHSSNMSIHLTQHQIYQQQQQQQQRALNVHRHRQHAMQQHHHQQHNQIDNSCHPTIPNVGSENGGINYQRDGRLSPTSNQLAQWFSPELLAQATAGKLPLININQALSLEEFERSIQHSSAAVHN